MGFWHRALDLRQMCVNLQSKSCFSIEMGLNEISMFGEDDTTVLRGVRLEWLSMLIALCSSVKMLLDAHQRWAMKAATYKTIQVWMRTGMSNLAGIYNKQSHIKLSFYTFWYGDVMRSKAKTVHFCTRMLSRYQTEYVLFIIMPLTSTKERSRIWIHYRIKYFNTKVFVYCTRGITKTSRDNW